MQWDAQIFLSYPPVSYSLSHSLLDVRVSLGHKFDQVSISYML
jgi:hypothetical protein